MGLQSIMDAKEIVLIAFGPKKIHAIKGLVEGPITEEVPASILQKHPKVTVICDEASCSIINKIKSLKGRLPGNGRRLLSFKERLIYADLKTCKGLFSKFF